MVDFSFNAEEFPDLGGDFEPLPPGWYQAMAVDSDMAQNKSGTGERLNFQFQILKPEKFANRRVFLGLNIKHENSMAQEIAQKELAAFCRAAKKINMRNTEELHGVPVLVKLRIDPGNDRYEPRNEIRAFKPADDGSVSLSDGSGGGQAQPPGWGVQKADEAKPKAQAAQPESEPVPEVSKKPPWEK